MKEQDTYGPLFIVRYRQLLERVLFDQFERYTASAVAASLEGYALYGGAACKAGKPEPPESLADCLANLATAARVASDESLNELGERLSHAPVKGNSIVMGKGSSDILGHTLAADAPIDSRRLYSLTILNPLIDELHTRALTAARAAEEGRLADCDLCRLVALGAVVTLELIAFRARHGNTMLGRKQRSVDKQQIVELDDRARELKKKGCKNVWATLARAWAEENGRSDLTKREYRALADKISHAVKRYRDAPR